MEIAEFILLTVVGIVLILVNKIVKMTSLSLDINRWLERRDERKKQKRVESCGHFTLKSGKGFLEIKSTFHTYPGTLAYQCTQCGGVTYDAEGVQELLYEQTELARRAVNRL